MTHLDWLRDVGKHFTIPHMLAKESVRSRLDQGVLMREHAENPDRPVAPEPAPSLVKAAE